ncbi:hypothetical protein K490DRAFT_60838 [Saccharata proteae CBS 121410]|uniref:Rhodopsin domain-containing protein n=1 Tax=Saccharata proteae CBS 121410 TaxID=1314787 RepID=A0A9P4I292_9PEZI|nr:hypothetical protein K490DRAFT_60838 [Saccharata proteae CBS 121410]
MSALLCCALPALFMRFYVRTRIVKKFGVDDWAMVGAGVLNAVYITVQTGACVNGFGAHTSELSSVTYVYSWGSARNGDVSAALRFWYLTTIFFVLTSCAVRVAVCLLLFKTEVLQQRRGTITTVMVLSIIIGGAMFLLLIFQCGTSTEEYWSSMRSRPQETCLKPDILTGICAIAPSALSILFIPDLKNTSDLTFSATNFSITLLVPPSVGITAASLATLDPWLKELGVLTARPGYSINWQQARGRRVPRQPIKTGMMTGRERAQGVETRNGSAKGRVRFEEDCGDDLEDQIEVQASGALRGDSDGEGSGDGGGKGGTRQGSGSQADRETPVPEGSLAGTENEEQQLVTGVAARLTV